MKLLEHEAKALLRAAGLVTPVGELATTAEQAAEIASRLGPVAVKAQVRIGGRGKAGGIRLADDADAAGHAASAMLGQHLRGELVESVLVEQKLDIAHERYLAVAIDTSAGCPVVLYSAAGGVDIEDDVSLVQRAAAHPTRGLDPADADAVGAELGVAPHVVTSLVAAFNDLDAVLVEVNPLVITVDGAILAADGKIELDDSAGYRQGSIAEDEPADVTTQLEAAAAAIGLRLIELGGNVAILANGAGLTMTTMDAVAFAGGRPANFLEIGGDAYTKAVPALELVLRQEGVKSLLVNFCGAFARCDVMTAGVLEAWETLQPDLPIFFSVHGTGQDEARAMLRERLGIEPFERMEDAVAAAVAAAEVAS